MLMSAERQPIIDGDIARISLTQEQVALIDAADVELVAGRFWSAYWSKFTRSFYAVSGARPTLRMHKLILADCGAPFVDHINHDTLDNRRANLRPATRSDNNRNCRMRTNNTSGYVGVVYFAPSDRWRARVSIERQEHRVGYFATAELAALARDQYIREHCPSEFWKFNFPLVGERGIEALSENTRPEPVPRTECVRGHPLSGERTREYRGARICMECRRLRQLESRRARALANPGPGTGSHQRNKTHCVQGHPFDEANTYVTKQGTRQCKECSRQRVRARRLRGGK